jgi:hypothetical protein
LTNVAHCASDKLINHETEIQFVIMTNKEMKLLADPQIYSPDGLIEAS